MRIGLVTGEYPPMQGGVGAFAQTLARALVQQGHAVSIFTGVQAREQDTAVRLRNAVRRWNYGAIRALDRWAKTERLDILNVQYQTAAYAMSPYIHFIPNLVRVAPVVTTFHDLRCPYLFPKAGRLRALVVRHLAWASAGAIATNHEDMERLSDLRCAALIPIGSNITVPLPADFRAETWRAKLGASGGDFIVGYFGFLNRSKGVGALLDSLSALRASGVPARLVMVGGPAGASDPTNVAYVAEIVQRIQSLGLQPFVHRTGFVDDAEVAAGLTACDAVVLPFLDGASYRRGSLMAAIRYGCAIVTTTPAVSIPTFADGENMLLVPPGDSDALADALRRLYELPELRAKLRHGASQLAGEFDWERIARETAAFFERVRREANPA